MILSLLFLSIQLSAQMEATVTKELVFTDEELKGDILFIGGYHGVTNADGELAIAKQNHDFTGYIPIEGRSDSGYVIVNHELILRDPLLGDGGGMTVFTVHRPEDGRWVVIDDERGKYRSVDFRSVGGTMANCGGFQTPWGTVLTAEEYIYFDNAGIYKDGTGITDTSDYTVTKFNGKPVQETIKRYENFDWMVEVDVANAKAIRKNYNMGRYGHEGGAMLPDGKTVFLTDDYAPGFIYKFVADRSFDLSSGQLYVYKQNANAIGGEWLKMPMDLRSLIDARETSAQMGATMFNRTEWAVHLNGKIYFTETGKDDTEDFMQRYAKMGGVLPEHLKEVDAADGSADLRLMDYYGRILELDMESGHLRVYLAGGQGTDQHFSNPDGLAVTYVNGKPVLMVNEDLNGYSHGRVPPAYNQRINEIYCLDLSLQNPTIDDLAKLAIGPAGCETTGGRFTPDGSTYFVNVQHPKTENKFPFNNSVTVAVRHIDSWIARVLFDEQVSVKKKTRQFHRETTFTFDKKKRFQVFNMAGEMVMSGKTRELKFTGLHRGKYQLLLDDKLEPIVIQ